jgi:malonate transporter and related proteins
MVPVFLLIFLGWLSVRVKLVGEEAKKICSTMVSDLVFPALLFSETYKANPADVFNGKWMLAFLIAMCLMWAIGYGVNKTVLRKDMRGSAMLAMLCSFPNMGGMGIPFLALLIGASSALSVAVANVIVAVTVIPATLFLLELGATVAASGSPRKGRQIFGAAVVKALKKPMVFSVILGLVFSVSGMSEHLPKFIVSTLDIASKSTNFVSLFAVGVAIYGTRLTLNRELTLNLVLKCLLNPVIVWTVVVLFGLTGTRAEEMILLLAMPTATTATILAYQWNVQEREASSLYMATTALSIVTLPGLLMLMKLYLPGVA